MNESQNARQQIVEKIKGSSNILVTVSTSPSVDELSAALGLTSMLNGLKKHATAVVSGDIPPAITFLEPNKTFEDTVSSLRDFIIALDKEKADHLRYKVEGDVVKIFITPYRTTITQNDLEFSQGDYNVELVLALGVKDKGNLDAALQAHGKIFHDATVATFSCGDAPSKLGDIDWHDPNASSISEMLVSVSEALKTDSPIMDEQIATAFLTGIVAATDRFSNNKTSSKVMTMAAQLMAAGANQQLIAAKLEEAHEIGPNKENESAGSNTDGTTTLSEGETTKLTKDKKADESGQPAPNGELSINHEKVGTLEEVAVETAVERQAEAAKTAEEALAEQLTSVNVAPPAPPTVEQLQDDLAAESASMAMPEPELPPVVAVAPDTTQPTLGGTLNATAEQAHQDKMRAIADDRNRTLLSHDSSGHVADNGQPSQPPAFNSAVAEQPQEQPVDIFSETLPHVEVELPPQLAPEAPPMQTLEDIDRMNRSQQQTEAQDAVTMAYEALPPPPPVEAAPQQFAEQPPAMGEAASAAPLPPPPPVDFSQLPPPPPLPDFSSPQGALPPEQLGQIFGAPPQMPAPVVPAGPQDPNQFKIPGQ